MKPSASPRASIPKSHYADSRPSEPFAHLSKEDAFELLRLPEPIKYFAMNLASRGVDASSAAFYMEAVRDPEAVYRGMIDSIESVREADNDVVAQLYFRRLPSEDIAARILFDERLESVDLNLMQVARQKAFRYFSKTLEENLDVSRELLGYLHTPDVVESFYDLNASSAAEERRLNGDVRQFTIDTLAEEAGDRFASASTLYLEFGLDAQKVLDVLTLQQRTAYNDFFLTASIMHNAGLGRQIPDYADLFLQAEREGKDAVEFINTVN